MLQIGGPYSESSPPMAPVKSLDPCSSGIRKGIYEAHRLTCASELEVKFDACPGRSPAACYQPLERGLEMCFGRLQVEAPPSADPARRTLQTIDWKLPRAMSLRSGRHHVLPVKLSNVHALQPGRYGKPHVGDSCAIGISSPRFQEDALQLRFLAIVVILIAGLLLYSECLG